MTSFYSSVLVFGHRDSGRVTVYGYQQASGYAVEKFRTSLLVSESLKEGAPGVD
jgi:hypothetical protein